MSGGESPDISWMRASGIHAGRLLKRWTRSPVMIASAVGVPVAMIAIITVMFSGMVEQFSGVAMDMAGVAIMIAVAQAFTGSLLGAGAIVQERQEGLPQRLATLPVPRGAAVTGRVLAESARAFVSVLAALAMGVAYGASFGGLIPAMGTLLVLAVVAVAAGTVGVMIGYLVETPQGAFSFAPLVMAAMFFNTAMMPRDMYAAVLRPFVDASPVTAVTQLVNAIAVGRVEGWQVLVFVLWFGGLTALSLLVLGPRGSGVQR